MTAHRVRSLLLSMVLAVSFAGAIGLAVVRDGVYGEPPPAAPALYMTSGEAIRRSALSFASVMSDVYWIRSLQYFGGTRLSDDPRKDYDLLYPLLDITTTLDPHFKVAFRFGAIFLAEPFPGGAGRPDLAVRLLQKGFAEDPGTWRYLQDIGFVYYWWVGDFEEAAEWFKKASEVPGAPWWMKSMAAVTLAEGGDRRSSRVLWESLLESADNDWLRNNARLRLEQLDAMDQIDVLQEIVRAYVKHRGRLPSSWEALVSAGYLRGVPVDPAGVAYVIEPATGAVTVSQSSRLSPLPAGERTHAKPR